MPFLASLDANPAVSQPEFGQVALLIAAVLAAFGVLLVILLLLWINRRMKKAIGLSDVRIGTHRSSDNLDPWVEAGQRVDGDTVDSLYKQDEN
ncbi:MAG: hypothetical protein P8M22_10990 [Phycisphaerales bacterium]|nr:hypothetical protein [Phycisphaerales bacterium]